MAKRTTFSYHLQAFKSEAQMMLRFYLSWSRIFQFKDMQSIRRTEFGDRLISLKAIENDLIIRISKLDDDTKGVHSFRKIIKEIPAIMKDRDVIISEIEAFRSMIKKIKQERRNEKLAHLKIGQEDGEYIPNVDLFPAIKKVVEIIDLLNGTKVSYNWQDGSYEKYELRKELNIYITSNSLKL